MTWRRARFPPRKGGRNGRKRGGLIGTNLRKGKGKGGWSIDESLTERTGAAMKWKYTHGGIDG